MCIAYSHTHRLRIAALLGLAAVAGWTAPAARAQAAPAPDTTKASTSADDSVATKEKLKDDTAIELSPFEVNATKDRGYAATTSLAGSRLNTDLRDVGAAVQVITPTFLKDVNATNLQQLLIYTTNTEVAGVGGNFYGGDAWDKGYAEKMLTEPQSTTRIRGLNNADVTLNYFPTDVPIDSYDVSRVDISRGPNSILFGLGSPAGLINSSLKVPNLNKRSDFVELQVGSYGSFRQVIDADHVLIPHQLGIRIIGLNDNARYRQDFTYNHDKRIYGAVRWEPKLGEGVFTQIDVQGESGHVIANRPVAGTPGDFISSWFGPANKLAIPNDVYWTAPGFVENLYASQTIGGQLWDDNPVSFFSDPTSGAVGLPGNPQAMLLRGGHNVDGGGWGSWVGMLNPNWIQTAANPKNTKAYYANNPTITGILNAYESQTGQPFSGFGQGLWPTQMIVSGPLATMMRDQNIVGPNKSEHNNFDDINLAVTQAFLHGRLGFNAAYNRQSYRDGYTNLMEGLWGTNIISVDVNQTLRGSNIPNPNFGRPYTIGEGRGGLSSKNRENWRITLYAQLKAADFFRPHSLLTRILGEHTLTGVFASQRYENFDRNFALYRWQPAYLQAVDNWNGFATWRGLHYLGPSLLNTSSMNTITGVTGVQTVQTPPLTQNVRYDNQGTWTQSNFSLISAQNDINQLYDGVGQGYDVTKSKSFVWDGKLMDNVIVPIFGWREDSYTRWNKPQNPVRDPVYGYVLPFSSDYNYNGVTPIHVEQQRTSWSIAIHGKELFDLLHHPLPHGMDVTLLYNDSSSFRPSDVSVNVYNQPEAAPSGRTRDLSVLLSAADNRFSLRITHYKTVQHNTPYFGPQPDFGWNKANLARTMDGMMWETGPWAGADPTKRVQPTPEWLINRWMFGDNYDKSIANTPLPANWRTDPNIMNEPLRIRSSAVPGSANYVAKGAIDPDTGLPYVAPPLTADEVAYRTEWFKARTDAQWSRPVDKTFWNAMGFARDYTAQWGGYWEPNAWTRPPNQRSLNDLTSTGMEYELTANPLPNWRVSINASKAEAVRSSVLTSWDAYIKNNMSFWFDGGYKPNDAPATDYWSYKGYYDIAHTPGEPLDANARFGPEYNSAVLNPYYQAKATADQAVNELRKWHWNAVTNYTFTRGFLKNVGIGGAVRWQDRPLLGYYPKYNASANSWVIDLTKPIMGGTEINYDAWLSYRRAIGHGVVWNVQFNVYNLFAKSSLIPIQDNPDGTVAQVRIPASTTWSLRNTFEF
ncbi:ferrichrome-iron receptor precursor [mine drainage metagenome]|uniref:Ferrichrome-iron receptor n=1 Tax=mine drainage metagenome TaxID=410659 RepID=A0A1J5T5P2_9ZZZZ